MTAVYPVLGSNSLEYDVAIVGAGPSGSTAAWYLANQGHKVLLIDKDTFPRDKVCGDALSPLAVDRLHSMGLLPFVIQAGAKKVNSTSITFFSGTTVSTRFDDFLESSHAYGLVSRRHHLDDILRRKAQDEGAVFMGGVTVERMHLSEDRIQTLHLSNDVGTVSVSARHYTFATGSDVRLLQRYDLVAPNSNPAIALRAYCQVPAHGIESFCLYFDYHLMPGYGWVFPVDDDLLNIGVGSWGVNSTGKRLLLDFISSLQDRDLISNLVQVSRVKGYPIRSSFPHTPLAGRNWTIVGEAAGLVNPLTGEGIDLAMESGNIAAQAIDEGFRASLNPGDIYRKQVLHRFRGMFLGMRAIRRHIINPTVLERLVAAMRRDKSKSIYHAYLNVALGHISARALFAPRLLWRIARFSL